MMACLWGKQELEKRAFVYTDCFWTVHLAHVLLIQSDLPPVPERVGLLCWSTGEGHSPLCPVPNASWHSDFAYTPTDKPCLEHFDLSLLWDPCHTITLPHLSFKLQFNYHSPFCLQSNWITTSTRHPGRDSEVGMCRARPRQPDSASLPMISVTSLKLLNFSELWRLPLCCGAAWMSQQFQSVENNG